MTVKQTDRVKIQQFGSNGVEIFDQIEALLRGLVVEMAEVNYSGTNAFDFKTKCTQHAVDFSGKCSVSMQQMSASVSEQTTAIASAMGGASISLDPPSIDVEMPAIDADTSVESAEDGPLIALRTSVKTTCDQVEAFFTQNLTNLQVLGQDGWVGPEYDATLKEVGLLTEAIIEDIDNSRTVMMGDITNQLDSLNMPG